MILQLNPPVPVYIPCKLQEGLAHIVIDYGPEYHLMWVVFLDNGECWTMPNPQIRAQTNQTLERKIDKLAAKDSQM